MTMINKSKLLLTPTYLPFLKECFDTSHIDDGVLIWQERPRHHFKSDKSHQRVNKMFAGNAAGDRPRPTRPHVYVNITHPELGNMRMPLHRLIWCLKFEETPPKMIDHINRIPFDNRPKNLRPITTKENNENSIHSKTCLSSGEVTAMGNGKFKMVFQHPGASDWKLEFNDKTQAIACINYLSYLYDDTISQE
ncbi:HNH endonuclease [Tropicimonas sediminicola]|uniref:HNH endonuclease n=1 Tax=Tropicimonas sediminicola TaxID=1031541 RepID=A0A239DKV9_9RHOB|nr:HNH endonuclease [Tropicimonas sediminicola]SNS32323.1 HNH endonuclease [Tropicimonas sediminicola]